MALVAGQKEFLGPFTHRLTSGRNLARSCEDDMNRGRPSRDTLLAVTDRTASAPQDAWPDLPLDAWSDTYATLHLWTQIVGKIRLAQSPWINHSWHVTLYVTARGLTTSPIPHGTRTFQIDFDFIDHQLRDPDRATAPDAALRARAAVGGGLLRAAHGELGRLGLARADPRRPNEVADAIPFDRGRDPRRLRPATTRNRFWRVLVQADRVFKTFRARFIGKCSPVHFFWGAPTSRSRGSPAGPRRQHPGGIPNLPDRVTREAYSHEVSSCGFWPGGGPIRLTRPSTPTPIPSPPGSRDAPVAAGGGVLQHRPARVHPALRRRPARAVPDETLLEFLQSTYEAAADLGGWDRKALERSR